MATNDLTTGEHIGTHLDAPYHLSQSGDYVDELPFDNLHRPAVIVDIREKVKTNQDALLTDQDLMDWEKEHGKIPDKAWIIMHSGW